MQKARAFGLVCRFRPKKAKIIRIWGGIFKKGPGGEIPIFFPIFRGMFMARFLKGRKNLAKKNIPVPNSVMDKIAPGRRDRTAYSIDLILACAAG